MGRGGFPGGGSFGGKNLNKIMQQAKKMQDDMQKVQQELAEKTVEATAGGGVVKAIASGKKEIKEIVIQPEAVDPDDVEMLQDLVLAAINEALRKAEEIANEEMGKVTGGLDGMPGMF